MHRVIEVIGKEKKGDLWLVYVLLEDGEEASGFDLEVGDKVMRWYDPQHDKVKVKKLLT